MRTWTRFVIGLVPAILGGGIGLSSGASAQLVVPATASAPEPNYQGLWWHTPAGSESGWGINFAHQGDVIFATWFTYDTTGKEWWLSMTARKTAEGTYAGALIQTAGPAFSAQPFDPAQVTRTVVGTGTLTFHWDGNNASFEYTVNGVHQTKALIRQMFGPLPTCTYGAKPDFAAATNYQDLWWVADGAESGWGINLTHQGNDIFATWFTYDGYGAPFWLSVTANNTGPGIYRGDLIRTAGPAFNAIPFDATQVTRTVVGAATFTFANGNAGTFAYTVSGISQTKTITRQLFAPPAGTVCSDTVPSVAAVTVYAPTLSPSVGDVVQLTAEARDASGAVIPGTTAATAWQTSDGRVAGLSATGLLWAAATGTVTASATIGGVTGTQTLTITPPMRVSVSVGPKEVVFRYATDRCYDLDVPDHPPRAVRAEDGSIVLFTGNAPRYFVSRGADFGSLKRDCSRPALESADRRTPESYENLEWLYDVYREGSRWHAFIHNEYFDPFASTCSPGNATPSNPCWYNSVTYGVSTDGARSFTKPFAPAHTVAPPPYVWVPPSVDTPRNPLTGSFAEMYGGTRVFRAQDGYYYTGIWFIPSKSDPANMGWCALRTDRLDDPASWRVWNGSGFNLPLTNPYVTGRPGPLCTYLPQPLPQYFNTYLEQYMNAGIGPVWVDGKWVCGVYFQLAATLFAWSPPQLIVETFDDRCDVDAQKPGLLEPVYVRDTALIDHSDPTVNFERPGRTAYFYYIRFNRAATDPLYWLDRDVVRVPLTFTRLD
jgi:hypothetical protein